MSEIRTILCPVDFSDASKAALGYAAMLAARFDARIDVLHIAEPGPYDMAGDVIRAESTTGGVAGQARSALNKRVDALVQEAAGDAKARVKTIVESGYPAQCILARLEREDYDLAVMGTAGRKGVAHLLMGSVAETVVRSSPCPVLTLRAG